MQLGKRMFGGKMVQSQKSVFWHALIVTVVIFGLGIFSGILLENSRVDKVGEFYQNSEIQLLDLKLVNSIYSQGFFDCDAAKQENIKFADQIYEEAKLLDNYESASRLNPESLGLFHKKYDILRAMLFVNSLEIKETCNSSYDTIVYFYDYSSPELEVKSRQEVFSNLLFELKERRGSNLLLISMAGDNQVNSIKVLMNNYNISESELPVVLINEKIKLTEIQNIEQFNDYLNN